MFFATAGTDFTSPIDFEIPAGQTSGIVLSSDFIVDDNVPELLEGMTLTLQPISPTQGASTVEAIIYDSDLDAADTFTEKFGFLEDFSFNGFDLGLTRIMFTPTGTGGPGSTYTACRVSPSPQLPIDPDPAGGLVLPLGNEGSVQIDIIPPLKFYGYPFSSIYVNSNGYIEFVNPQLLGTTDPRDLSQHFFGPRISVSAADWDPSANGAAVIVGGGGDVVSITWQNVAVPGFADFLPRRTFQVNLYLDGRIELAWLIDSGSSQLVGLSLGTLLDDFAPTDLGSLAGCDAAAPVLQSVRSRKRHQ